MYCTSCIVRIILYFEGLNESRKLEGLLWNKNSYNSNDVNGVNEVNGFSCKVKGHEKSELSFNIPHGLHGFFNKIRNINIH
jgi:hypothetical protein